MFLAIPTFRNRSGIAAIWCEFVSSVAIQLSPGQTMAALELSQRKFKFMHLLLNSLLGSTRFDSNPGWVQRHIGFDGVAKPSARRRSKAHFEIGDFVRLRAGGPSMQIVKFEGAGAKCVWFIGSQRQQAWVSSVVMVPAGR